MAATKGWPYFLRARFLSRIRFNILRFDGNFFFFLFLSPITILVDIYKYRYFVVHFIALLISEYLSQWVRKFQTEENLLNI